ncbi:MAG: CHASE domain-containing protein, partial [Candidatus Rokuibacteriota bacterium]
MSQLGSSRSGAIVGAAGSSSASLLGSLGRAWPAGVVLACALLLTFGAWRYAERTVRAHEQERFDRVMAVSRAAIDRRLEGYLQILTGVRALFASSSAVERAEFRSYIAGLILEGRYPSLRGIGWVPRVPAASRAPHEALMRRGGPPGYEIHPAGSQPDSYPLAFLEPFEAFEATAFGFDVSTRPENRKAMEQARDTGVAAMSRRLALLRDGGEAGFVIFLPVYRAGGSPATVEARRQAFDGFVAAAFRPDLMMGVLFGPTMREPVDLELIDAPEGARGTLLYGRERAATGAPRTLRATVPVTFGGHTWTLRFAALPAFHSRAERLMPYWVLGSGLVISLLAFVITLLQTRALTAARRHGADLRMAERRLRRANERFELAAAAVSSAIYDRNLQHETVTWTPGLTEMCGYRLDEADPTYEWWNERVHPDDRPRVHEQLAAGAAAGHDLVAEYRFRARDGGYLDVLDRGRVVRDASGRAVRIVGSMVDVSERKRAEAV